MLCLMAVDPEQTAGSQVIHLFAVFENSLPADGKLDQIGRKVFSAGIVLRPAVKVPQLDMRMDGSAVTVSQVDLE